MTQKDNSLESPLRSGGKILGAEPAALRVGVGQIISPQEQSFGAILLHHECWCWGCDIRRKEGNLLLKYGFERMAPAEGQMGTSRYELAFAGTEKLALWGFGLGCCDLELGTIYLNRYQFSPRITVSTDWSRIWREADIEGLRPPDAGVEQACVTLLMRQAVRWIIHYETWVRQTCGRDYRRCCLDEWPQRSLADDEILAAWKRLAREIQQEIRAWTSVRAQPRVTSP